MLLLFTASLGLAAMLTHDRVFLAGNGASRFAHIQTLAERGHSHIDGSKYAWTPDRGILEGRSFSNKPQLLGMVGAGGYRGLRHLFGLHFHDLEAETVYLLAGAAGALLFGVGGLIAALGRNPLLERRSALLLAGSVAATILFHASVAGSFGGWSYGFRSLIPTVPILLFFAPLLWRGRLPRIFAPVLALSVLLALIGAYNPWPPVDEQNPDSPGGLASIVTNPVGTNLATWAEEHVPGSAATQELGARFISPDPVERRRYLSLFFRSKGERRMQARIQRRSLRE